MAFFWEGNTGQTSTPQQAARKRALAESMLAQSGSGASNWGEGLARVAQALTGTVLEGRASDAERAGADEVAALLAGLSPESGFSDITAALSNPWVAESPGGSSIAQALLSQNMQRNDPMYQIQLERAIMERDALRNPPPAQPSYDFEGGQWWQRNPDGSVPFAVSEPAPDALTSAIQNYEFLIGQGVDPATAQQQAFGGQTINVGNGQPTMGTVPAGYAAVEDPNNPSGFRLEVIPGGPVAAEAAAADAAALAGQGQTERYGNVVTEDIGRALDIIEADPAFTTGVVGQVLSNIGGSPANRVRNLVDTVKSNVGFDRLQAMRESSPTGGALGSVTERELSLLTSAIGSLEQSNNADDLAYNLRRVNNIYMDIIHGPGNWDPSQKVTPGGEWTDMGDGVRIRVME